MQWPASIPAPKHDLAEGKMTFHGSCLASFGTDDAGCCIMQCSPSDSMTYDWRIGSMQRQIAHFYELSSRQAASLWAAAAKALFYQMPLRLRALTRRPATWLSDRTSACQLPKCGFPLISCRDPNSQHHIAGRGHRTECSHRSDLPL